jgi:uncharacterized protein (TIGR02391 family)
MTELSLRFLLHQRILDKCEGVYLDGHWPQAASEAMKQVEIGIKERAGIIDKKLYGRKLISKVFGEGRGIKLRAFHDELQKDVETYFKGAFGYYRNYLMHAEAAIDELTCITLLIMASELLRIIDASSLSLTDMGGVEGLIENKFFSSKEEIKQLLSILNGKQIIDDVVDGFFEDLACHGFGEEQYLLMLELRLVEYKQEEGSDAGPFELGEAVTIGRFELTPLGETILRDLGPA